MGSETRRRSATQVMVRVTTEEKAAIAARASEAGMSAPGFMRTLALGAVPTAKADAAAVRELAQANADLGRLGGLLKMALSEGFTGGVGPQEMRRLLKKIEAQQAFLGSKAQEL